MQQLTLRGQPDKVLGYEIILAVTVMNVDDAVMTKIVRRREAVGRYPWRRLLHFTTELRHNQQARKSI